MAYKSQAIILVTLGWFLGVSTVVGIIKMQEKEVVLEPVVCVVQLNSKSNNQTHNFKGVVK